MLKNIWVVKIFEKVAYVAFYLNLNLKGGGSIEIYKQEICRFADPCRMFG